MRTAKTLLPALFLALSALSDAQVAPVEALVYSTMPSLAANRPERAMDGDEKTAFRSYYGMEDGDTFLVRFSRPVPAKSIRVTTGDAEGNELLTDAVLETSADGSAFVKVGAFGKDGMAMGKASTAAAIRIRMNPRKSVSHLVIREIAVESAVKISRVQMGPGRGFVDLAGHDELKEWSERAERQMESFWADAAAILYSDGFVTPNAINVVYALGKDLPPGAYGGGRMTVDVAWARSHPEDTGLTVHEMAHAVQSGGAPGWLIEAVADYIRWIKFEPQNHRARIDVAKATPHDPYRTGATFLGWLELHYDRKLVTKLNDDARFGRYKDSLFERYCGKDIDALWKEFVAAYQKDPVGLLTPEVPAAMRPRAVPTVQAGTSVAVDLAFDVVGAVEDGRRFASNGGFDAGGAAFSSTLLGLSKKVGDVVFRLGSSVAVSKGQTLALSGRHKSLWLLASAIEGGQRDQAVVVTYADGTTQRFDQNFSDWYQPEGFPGEVRAVRMAYRNLADGSRDPRTFYAYGYGFALDPSKTLKGLTLPKNENIRVLAVSVAD